MVLSSVLLLALVARADDYFNIEGFNYHILDESAKTVEIEIGYDVSGDVYIPDYVWYNDEQYKVVAIGGGIPSDVDYNVRGITSVYIPPTIKTIGEYAFAFCGQMTSVTIPGSVVSIGDYAFACSGVASENPVELHSGIEYIGVGAFTGTYKGVEISYNPYYTSMDGVLYSADMTVLYSVPTYMEGEFIVPEMVKTVEKKAFYHSRIESVIFPEGMTSLYPHIFWYCDNLKSVNFPTSLKDLPGALFYECENVENLNVSPDSPYLKLHEGVLYSWHGYRGSPVDILISCPSGKKGKYRIPDDTSKIGYWAFDRTSLNTIIFPPVEGEKYKYEPYLNGAFMTYNNVHKLVMEGGDPLTTGGGEFQCYYFDFHRQPVLMVPLGGRDRYKEPYIYNSIGNAWASFEKIADVYDDIFCYRRLSDTDKTAEISGPNELLVDDEHIMNEYKIPPTVNFAGETYSVNSIGDWAFENYDNLEDVTIPSTIKTVGKKAFDGCNHLYAVRVEAIEPPAMPDYDTFTLQAYQNATLIVPEGTRSIYATAIGWRRFKNVVENTSAGININIASSGENNNVVVYNLQGSEVYCGDDYDTRLTPGMYIIKNGSQPKKIVIK